MSFIFSLQVHPRYMGIGKQTKDLHMYNMLAVEQRINAYHLPNDRPVCRYSDFNMRELLPNVEDNAELRKNWIVLVGRVLIRHMPRLATVMKPSIPTMIKHKYMKEAKQKNKVVRTNV